MEHNCMIRKGIGFVVLVLVLGMPLHADEGMWLLPLLQELNIDRMQELGCELTAAEIYNSDSISLKNWEIVKPRMPISR